MNVLGRSGATYVIEDDTPRTGGQGLVYRARCLDDARVVGLKVALAPGSSASGFRQLARWAEHSLVGARIVPVWDEGDWEGRPFLVMEWLPMTLEARAAGQDLEARLMLAREIVRALAELHAVGFAHGDIKASNVMYAEDGSGPFFTDIVVDAGLFSPGLAAPEQIAGGMPTQASDRFSLACLIWRLIAGAAPSAPHLALSELTDEALGALTGGHSIPLARAFRWGSLTCATREDQVAFDLVAPGQLAVRRSLEALLEPQVRVRGRDLVGLAAALAEASGHDPQPSTARSRWTVLSATAAVVLVLSAGGSRACEPRTTWGLGGRRVSPATPSAGIPGKESESPPCPVGYSEGVSACVGADGQRVVRVPGGRVALGHGMGDAELAPDSPPRSAWLTRALWVDVTETTQASWAAMLGGYSLGARTWTSEGVVVRCDAGSGVGLLGPDLPAVCVSWLDAVAYANARSARDGLSPAYALAGEVTWDRQADGWRLPTEAEWEHLARGTGGEPWAGAPGPERICGWANLRDASAREKWGHEVPCDDGAPALAPVARYAHNPWGIYDVLGNALEWVWDRYGEPPSGAAVDPAGPLGGLARVQKGGSWNHVARGVAARYADAADSYSNVTGVRLVRYASSTESLGPSSTNTSP